MMSSDRTWPLFPGEADRRSDEATQHAQDVAATNGDGLPSWSANAVLALLKQWSEQGWLRRLDVALPAMLAGLESEQHQTASPWLLLCSAVLCHLEGRGHTCLSIAEWLNAPLRLMALPSEASESWHSLWACVPGADVSARSRGALLADCIEALSHSKCVDVGADLAHGGSAPLVLDGLPGAPRLYLRRYWMHEQRVARALAERTSPSQPAGVTAAREEPVLTPVPSASTVRHWLDRLFVRAATHSARGTAEVAQSHEGKVDWQKLACAMAARGRFAVITGGPGTGKTYTAARLLALLLALAPKDQSLRVALAAPTGKAAARLKQSIDNALKELPEDLKAELHLTELIEQIGAARTLHSLLGARPDTRAMQHDAQNPLDVDVLIVDEASMVHLEMMSALMDAMPARARIILLGDKDQLASVEAGAVLGDLCREAAQGGYDDASCRWAEGAAGIALPPGFRNAHGTPLAQHTVMLRESRRFDGVIGELAMTVNRGDVEAWRCLRAKLSRGTEVLCCEDASREDVLALAQHGRHGAPGGFSTYLQQLARMPAASAGDVARRAWVTELLQSFDRFRILCAVRQGPWGVESLNQDIQSVLFKSGLLRGGQEWFAGRPVMVTRNDSALGIFNGDIGVALPAADSLSGLRVWFMQGDSPRAVSLGRLPHVETAFAMTVHKSQGSEFEHAVLVLPPGSEQGLTRELVYTGITRAKSAFTLMAPSADLLTGAMTTPTLRGSGLLPALSEMNL